jgi:RNA polymerase sigma-32 factor
MNKRETTGFTSSNFVKSHRVLLTEEEEIELFTNWQKTKDQEYLTQIVVSYSPIILKAIKELSGYRMDPEELTSEGLIALIEAAKRYELERGLRFSTYAKTWVKGVMYGFITKNYFLVHVCTSHMKKKLFFALRKLIAIEMRKNGSFSLTTEMAASLAEDYGTTITEIQCMYDMFRKPHDSLSETVGKTGDTDITKGDLLTSNTPLVEETTIINETIEFQKRIVADVMDKVLTPRERRIFISQKLREKGEVITLDKLGKRFHISKERVRQIRNEAHGKIEEELKKRIGYMGIDPIDLFV